MFLEDKIIIHRDRKDEQARWVLIRQKKLLEVYPTSGQCLSFILSSDYRMTPGWSIVSLTSVGSSYRKGYIFEDNMIWDQWYK